MNVGLIINNTTRSLHFMSAHNALGKPPQTLPTLPNLLLLTSRDQEE